MALAPIKVLIADDHTMLREGLRRTMSANGIEVVGEAADGRVALEKARETKPDVVLMDLTMEVMGGIEATRRIRNDLNTTKVVILSMHDDDDLRSAAMKAGASAYLVKDCATTDILTAVHAAVGRTFGEGGNERLLTTRETEVLQHIADGLGTADVAAAMFVSLKTVKNHLASAYSKLETADRTQAVVKAAKLGIIDLDRR